LYVSTIIKYLCSEQKKKVMVTLLFLIIAYAIRKKFLPEDATGGEKFMYYVFSVVMITQRYFLNQSERFF